MNQFIILLALIVLSRGYFVINEQFLVGRCFVRFIRTRIIYYGDATKERLEGKRKELIDRYFTHKHKKLDLKILFRNILINRGKITANIHSLKSEFKRRREEGFENKIREEEYKFLNGIRSELNIISEYEKLVRPAIQNAINTLRINEESQDTAELYITTADDAATRHENFITRYTLESLNEIREMCDRDEAELEESERELEERSELDIGGLLNDDEIDYLNYLPEIEKQLEETSL
jgi:hypothetical protein